MVEMVHYLKKLDGTWAKVGDDFELALIIFNYNQKKEPIYFAKLLEETGWDKDKVSSLSDKLADFEIIYGDWGETSEGWRYCWYIDEDMDGFISGLRNMCCTEMEE